MKKAIKWILVCCLWAAGAVFAVCFTALVVVTVSGSERMVDVSELPSDADAILVLGAGVLPNGTPSDILRDRLDTALDIYRAGVCQKFLLSGDHGTLNYNEVGAMKKYLMARGVKEDVLFMDHAGFSTYDSMYRARGIFNINRVIVVTTAYHLPRSLYLAREFGMDAWGVPSDRREYQYIRDYRVREYLARVKDFFKLHVFRALPVYGGEVIPIQTSSGKETN